MATQVQAYLENIQWEIIQRLRGANISVLVAVAWLTDKDIFNELCTKARMGVQVELLLIDDDINIEKAPFDHLQLERHGGIVYFISQQVDGSKMHHKFCIIDNHTVITGSYNWSRQARWNDENIIITDEQLVVSKFKDEFDRIKCRANAPAYAMADSSKMQDYIMEERAKAVVAQRVSGIRTNSAFALALQEAGIGSAAAKTVGQPPIPSTVLNGNSGNETISAAKIQSPVNILIRETISNALDTIDRKKGQRQRPVAKELIHNIISLILGVSLILSGVTLLVSGIFLSIEGVAIGLIAFLIVASIASPYFDAHPLKKEMNQRRVFWTLLFGTAAGAIIAIKVLSSLH